MLYLHETIAEFHLQTKVQLLFMNPPRGYFIFMITLLLLLLNIAEHCVIVHLYLLRFSTFISSSACLELHILTLE